MTDQKKHIGASGRSQAELRRILWRQQQLSSPDGVARLTELVQAGIRERDLGPNLDKIKENQ